MKKLIYQMSLVMLTLVITVVFGLGTTGTALAKKAAPKKKGPKYSTTMIQDYTQAKSNDYVVLAAAPAKKAPPKKKH